MSDISFDEEETILLKLNEIETKLDKLDGQFKRNINTILKLGNTRIAKKTISIHQLVATAFIPNPENKSNVDHIDTNRTNNTVENLRWATQSENMNNKHTKKKRQIPIYCYDLDKQFVKKYNSWYEAAEKLKCSYRAIQAASYKPFKAVSQEYYWSRKMI